MIGFNMVMGSADKDLDIYVKSLEDAKAYVSDLISEGWLLYSSDKGKFRLYKFEGNPKLIDVVHDILWWKNNYSPTLTRECIKALKEYNNEYLGLCIVRLERTIRYLYTGRIHNIKQNDRFVDLEKVFKLCFYGDDVGAQQFKPTKSKLLKYRFRPIALIGVDGAGKSTIAAELGVFLPVKVFYMGDSQYVFKFSAKLLSSQKKILVPLKVLNFWIESWFKIVISMRYIMRGYMVIYDRWPIYQLVERRKGLGYILYFIFLKYLFINGLPNKIVLTSTPEEIYLRKKEKSISQIKSYYANLASLDKDHILIKNDNITKTIEKLIDLT